MSIITVFGIDPGLVHTGVVMYKIDTIKKVHRTEYAIIEGDDPRTTAAWVHQRNRNGLASIFIEKYEDRGTVFSTHQPMRVFEQELVKRLPGAKLVSNTGIKKVVTEGLMALWDVWNFPTTNHRDLQAAARIGFYGAIKDDELNRAFFDVTMKLLGKE